MAQTAKRQELYLDGTLIWSAWELQINGDPRRKSTLYLNDGVPLKVWVYHRMRSKHSKVRNGHRVSYKHEYTFYIDCRTKKERK